MMKRFPCIAAALATFALSSFASEVELNTSDIKKPLTNNPTTGVHYSKRTGQYLSYSDPTLLAGNVGTNPSESLRKVVDSEFCPEFCSNGECYEVATDASQDIYQPASAGFKAPFISKKDHYFVF